MYYGPHSLHGPTPSLNEGLLDDMQEKLGKDLRAEMIPQIRAEMRSELVGIMAEMGYSQQKLDVDVRSSKVTMYVSTKGSCATPSIEECPQWQSQLKPAELLGTKLVGFRGESTTLKLEHDDELAFFHINTKDITNMLGSELWLSITALQIWCMYIHRLCISKNVSDVYGILDPILFSPSKVRDGEDVQIYLFTKFTTMNK